MYKQWHEANEKRRIVFKAANEASQEKAELHEQLKMERCRASLAVAIILTDSDWTSWDWTGSMTRDICPYHNVSLRGAFNGLYAHFYNHKTDRFHVRDYPDQRTDKDIDW